MLLLKWHGQSEVIHALIHSAAFAAQLISRGTKLVGDQRVTRRLMEIKDNPRYNIERLRF